MDKNIDDFLNALKNDSKLKNEFDKVIKTCYSKGVFLESSFRAQVKFVCDIVIPFANLHGFKFGLDDIILDNDGQLADSFLEDISGGSFFNKKFLAGTLLALQTLTSVVPTSALSENNNTGVTKAVSVSSSVGESQIGYDSIINILKVSGEKMSPISDECPFNEVDGMILSTISYLPLNCVPSANSNKNHKYITVSEWGKRFSSYFKNFDKNLSLNNDDLNKVEQYRKDIESKDANNIAQRRTELLELVAKSPRYKNIKIGNFSSKYIEYKEKSSFYEQFAAVTYILENGTRIINFRGTDSTLASWKEDLDLLWGKTIHAQKDAFYYLEKVFSDSPNSKYIIAGHSKGGNLSAYAAFFLSKKNKKFMRNLDRIFNYDGADLNKETVSNIGKEVFEGVSKKLINFIPKSSVFGRVLGYTSKSKYVCVYSGAENDTDIFKQYDTLTWNISYGYEKGNKNSKFKTQHLKNAGDMVLGTTSFIMDRFDRNDAMRFFIQWLFDFMVRNKISIKSGQTLQGMYSNIFYNYFVGNKTYAEIINSVISSGEMFKIDKIEFKEFKDLAAAAFKAFLHAYWEKCVDINREAGVPEEINNMIEEMINSGCSFSRIYKLISVTTDKVLTWHNIKNFIKNLYS